LEYNKVPFSKFLDTANINSTLANDVRPFFILIKNEEMFKNEYCKQCRQINLRAP